MSEVFTLESLHEELENEFAPVQFEAGGDSFVLRNLLRCNKKERQAVIARLKELEALNDADQSEEAEDATLAACQFVLSTVTDDKRGARLLKAIGTDLLVNMKLLERWAERTQPGEATASPS